MHEKDERIESLKALLEGIENPLTNLANAAAWLWQTLADINWVGFYLLDRGALWLGPFQGKPACVRIGLGRGVCGAALEKNETLIVPDVHAFPGHIACDAASRSEIVVPLRAAGRPVGVLDIDSPVRNRFAENDRSLLEAVAGLIEGQADFTHFGYDLRP